MSKPKVVLTRTESDPHELHIKYPHIEWIEFPLIRFDYLELSQKILDEINFNFDYLVFTSQNGAKSFFEQAGDFPDKLIACVGPKTASVVESYGYKVDFIPSVYTSLTLAKELPIRASESLCYIGGNLSSSATVNLLKQRSKVFLQIESYQTLAETHDQEKWNSLFAHEADVISFCSPSAVKSFKSQIAEHSLILPKKTKFAAIGTTTSAAIKDDLSMTSVIGKKHTFASMIEKIVETIADDS